MLFCSIFRLDTFLQIISITEIRNPFRNTALRKDDEEAIRNISPTEAVDRTKEMQRYLEPPPDYDDEPSEYHELPEENGTSSQSLYITYFEYQEVHENNPKGQRVNP